MVTISEEQMTQVEYIIGQSMLGHHVLFEPEEVRRVFTRGAPMPVNEHQADSIESHIERVMAMPSLSEKREYLQNLDRATFDWVVRTYFTIVENNIYDQSVYTH